MCVHFNKLSSVADLETEQVSLGADVKGKEIRVSARTIFGTMPTFASSPVSCGDLDVLLGNCASNCASPHCSSDSHSLEHSF